MLNFEKSKNNTDNQWFKELILTLGKFCACKTYQDQHLPAKLRSAGRQALVVLGTKPDAHQNNTKNNYASGYLSIWEERAVPVI